MSNEQNTAQPADTLQKPFRHLHKACEWLGISKRQGEYEVQKGRLKVFWISGHPHVRDEDLLAYVQDRGRKPTPIAGSREEKRRARAERRQAAGRDGYGDLRRLT